MLVLNHRKTLTMKYTILINQAAVVEAGLHKITDLVDWAILEYIVAWQTNPEAERNQDDFVWINYKHFIAEMPLVGLNTKTIEHFVKPQRCFTRLPNSKLKN